MKKYFFVITMVLAVLGSMIFTGCKNVPTCHVIVENKSDKTVEFWFKDSTGSIYQHKTLSIGKTWDYSDFIIGKFDFFYKVDSSEYSSNIDIEKNTRIQIIKSGTSYRPSIYKF